MIDENPQTAAADLTRQPQERAPEIAAAMKRPTATAALSSTLTDSCPPRL